MTFDARSRERLRQLGRTLPQRLPAPESPAPGDKASSPKEGQRGRLHRLETETDPDELFHELMQASADGTVPPHLLERLRELEAGRRQTPSGSASAKPEGQSTVTTKSPQNTHLRLRRQGGLRLTDSKLEKEDTDLYVAFQQLLLEDYDDWTHETETLRLS